MARSRSRACGTHTKRSCPLPGCRIAGAIFPQTVDKVLSRETPSNHEIYSIDGTPVVDAFVRYEFLEDDLAALEERYQLSLRSHLPFTKHRTRADRRPAAEQLTAKQRETCFERNRAEFELFGYAA